MTDQPAVPSSLHERILRDLEDRILSGQWPPGHRIPSELDLTREYGCSRMTVNKVMTQLAQAGLIERKRKSGSIVRAQTSQNAILEIHDIRDEVVAAGGRYDFVLLECEVAQADGAEAARLGLSAGAPILRIACLHRRDAAPFCLENRIIVLATVPEAETADFAAQAPGVWLLEHVPWSEAEHEIGADAADAAMAARLGIVPGTPCLSMARRTWKQGEAVTEVRFAYPGALHRLRARFTPSQN